MKNIIAKSKTTDLIIQVKYMDSHITRGQVLVGDTFNKVGAVDYWSTSTLDIKGNDMKKIAKGTKLVCCNDFYLDGNKCLTKGKEYTVSMIGEDKESFFIIDDELEAHKFCFSDVPNVWFNFAKHKEDPIVKQVVDSFQERSKVGIEKYGTTLNENNTDDFYQHLSEELMDSLLYLQKLKTIKLSLNDFSENEIVEYLRYNGYKVKYKF
jgi:hypothetical protein